MIYKTLTQIATKAGNHLLCFPVTLEAETTEAFVPITIGITKFTRRTQSFVTSVQISVRAQLSVVSASKKQTT
jgi:hypothetical protein